MPNIEDDPRHLTPHEQFHSGLNTGSYMSDGVYGPASHSKQSYHSVPLDDILRTGYCVNNYHAACQKNMDCECDCHGESSASITEYVQYGYVVVGDAGGVWTQEYPSEANQRPRTEDSTFTRQEPRDKADEHEGGGNFNWRGYFT